jgi:hypothetical protein
VDPCRRPSSPRGSPDMIASFSPALTGNLIEEEYRSIARRFEARRTVSATFDATAYAPRSIARARSLWLDRMVNEYSSTTVFSQLAGQLVEANATLDATCVALRMAQDELRHAEICGDVVRALGGVPRRMRDTRVIEIARHHGCSDEERALRNVIFTTCLSEMVSVGYFVAALERIVDPFLRDATRRLLADEVLHGRFGFVYLEARADWLARRGDVRASIGRYLRFAFAVVERELAGGERPDAGPDDEALGIVPAERARATFDDTVVHAIIPGLERFGIPAEDAWRRRRAS